VIAAAVFAALLTLQAEVGKSSLMDPNLAAEKDLVTLPHMNAALAKGIIEKRPFLTMTDFDAYLGQTLSKEQRMELYGKAFVQINLNTAPDAEILMIPGAGNRMVREFKEYRVYPNLAKFRREIGKYVNAAEVARFEQYVFIPVNLNTATDEDIMTIPGMGARMLREFKEYRPYDSIQKFRREIGKYVNEKEVARFERYVTIQ
jgi:DNA uptake protein ComE-like DNA-binding protein